jgi:REP element-mobilizing transposase RayT
VLPQTTGIYYCTSRCVRHAFLCGEDALTGRSFEHRQQWLEDRILALAQVFAVAIHSYAVMSNHFHVIVATDPGVPWQWSDEEVARRWLALSMNTNGADSVLSTRIAQLAQDSKRLAVLRERLGSLSWFMRYLKEPIARRANKEDECKEHFWEGRFGTQTLLDDTAVLSSMVYVDLNPIRAAIALTPENSAHTSVRARSQARTKEDDDAPLPALASSIQSELSIVTTAQYLELVDWTARTLHTDTRGAGVGDAPTIIKRLGLRPRHWCLQVPATQSQYWRAIGHLESASRCPSPARRHMPVRNRYGATIATSYRYELNSHRLPRAIAFALNFSSKHAVHSLHRSIRRPILHAIPIRLLTLEAFRHDSNLNDE